jgi:hypothetical protein
MPCRAKKIGLLDCRESLTSRVEWGRCRRCCRSKLTATEALIASRGLAFPAAILEGRAERRTVTARTAAGTAAFARPAPSSSRMAWPLYGGSAGTARPCTKPSRKPARAFDRKTQFKIKQLKHVGIEKGERPQKNWLLLSETAPKVFKISQLFDDKSNVIPAKACGHMTLLHAIA